VNSKCESKLKLRLQLRLLLASLVKHNGLQNVAVLPALIKQSAAGNTVARANVSASVNANPIALQTVTSCRGIKVQQLACIGRAHATVMSTFM
jgi:hypothetical protein